MNAWEIEIAALKRENAILISLLERWQQQYGYREQWLPAKDLLVEEKAGSGPWPKELPHYKNNQI